jgi:tRNA threonylcarbamoyladenosine biosynthesis protein TsaE
MLIRKMQETTTRSAQETRQRAEEFAREMMAQQQAEKARLLCLWGGLGSGKTTFAQGLARHFGVKETVNSPTFLIMKKYLLAGKYKGWSLYHFDLYRVEEAQELLDLGWKEILAEGRAVVVVEWPEKAAGVLPAERTDIRFESCGAEERRITFQG